MIKKKDTAEKVVNLEQSGRSDQNATSRPARKGIYLLPNLLTTGLLSSMKTTRAASHVQRMIHCMIG